MLYNVLIVDDEILIRTGLRLSVPWNELGFKVAAEAGTAAEALQELENKSIDLALVDIQMPGTNGIEFIREMRHRFPYIKSLIISGHSDFDYTVSALKLEVCDYLLKPINMDELVKAVKNVRERIESDSHTTRIMKGQKAIARKMMVLRLLGKDFRNREEIYVYCNQCGIPVPLENYLVVAMKTHNFSNLLETKFQGQRLAFETLFDDCLYGNFEQDGDICFAALVGDYYAIVVQKGYADEIRGLLHQRAKEQKIQIKTGTGEAFEDIFFMDVSYLQAIANINQKEGQINKKTDEIQLSYLSNLIIQKLEEGRFKEVREIVDTVFLKGFTQETGILFNWCMNSIYSIVDYFQLTNYEEMKGVMVFPIDSMSNLYLYTTLHASFMEKIEKICTFLDNLKGSNNEMIVNKVCKIVKEEYSNPELSLQKIAANLDISYNYLSTVFKQISGENFSSYVTKIKINRAKNLVLERNLKMYEIAEQVGYMNARYFTEQFKKSVGMSPSEYKASKSKEKKGGGQDGISI